MESSMEIKDRTTIWYSNFSSEYIPKGKEKTNFWWGAYETKPFAWQTLIQILLDKYSEDIYYKNCLCYDHTPSHRVVLKSCVIWKNSLKEMRSWNQTKMNYRVGDNQVNLSNVNHSDKQFALERTWERKLPKWEGNILEGLFFLV